MNSSRSAGSDRDLSPRFTPGDDGLIRDRWTGLTWTAAPGAFLAWTEAAAFCRDLSRGGRTDWRLPELIELAALLPLTRPGRSAPAPGDVLPGPAGTCWTNTLFVSDHPFVVDFGLSLTYCRHLSTRLGVRAVAGPRPRS